MPALYQLQPIGVLKTDDGKRIIPQSGKLWDDYQKWLKQGNLPDPYIMPDTTPTLAEARAERKRYIESKWAEAEAAGFVWDSKTWASDQRALNRLWPSIVVAYTAQGQFTLNWSTKDGVAVALSKAQVTALNVALQAHLTAQHDRAQMGFQAINAATTVAQVQAVVW
jgi:hypothetical protein